LQDFERAMCLGKNSWADPERRLGEPLEDLAGFASADVGADDESYDADGLSLSAHSMSSHMKRF
jgi:hypothetical protein